MAELETEGRTTIVHTRRYPEGYTLVHRIFVFLLDFIIVLLAVRFLLRLAGANPGTPFVNFMYSLTEPLVAPFRGIFPTFGIGPGIIDWAALLAMIVYAFLIWAILRLIRILFSEY